jgi:acyl-CoA thioesterase I
MRNLAKNVLIIMSVIMLCGCSKPPARLSYLYDDNVVVAFGDSLTFGTGANKDSSYPVILQKLIDRKVINRGVPGLETAGGKNTIGMVIQQERPSLVILCLGGNDMLRQRKTADIKNNLAEIIKTILANKVGVLLVSVPRPSLIGNSPPAFYQDLAETFNIPIENKLLLKLEKNPAYKSDLIHLNAKGYRALAQGIAEQMQKSGAIYSINKS